MTATMTATMDPPAAEDADEVFDAAPVAAPPAPCDPRLSAAADRVDRIFAHLWMVRTFVKHSPEAEDFPELMAVVRAVFDASRALETRRADPPAYLRMLRKKLSKLRAAAEQFAIDGPLASDHTNFRMAVASMAGCVADLDDVLAGLPEAGRAG